MVNKIMRYDLGDSFVASYDNGRNGESEFRDDALTLGKVGYTVGKVGYDRIAKNYTVVFTPLRIPTQSIDSLLKNSGGMRK